MTDKLSEKYIYRRRADGIFEVGITSLKLFETRVDDIQSWDIRICETWDEKTALKILKALADNERLKEFETYVALYHSEDFEYWRKEGKGYDIDKFK